VPERLKAAELQGFATFCSELRIAANLLIIGATNPWAQEAPGSNPGAPTT